MNVSNLSGAGWDLSSIQNPHSHLFGAPWESFQWLIWKDQRISDQNTHKAHFWNSFFNTHNVLCYNKYLRKPGPLDVGVLLSAHTAYHPAINGKFRLTFYWNPLPVVVHCIDDGWVFLGALETDKYKLTFGLNL